MRVIFFIICLLSNQLALADELILREITPQTFVDQAPSPERKAIVKFITNQFADWQLQGITQAQLDQVWDNKSTRRDLQMARFQIIDQKLYADSYNITRPYFRILLSYLQKLLLTHKVQDVDFIFNIVDSMGLPMPKAIPSFIMSKNLNSPYEKDRFLIPDSYLLSNDWSPLITTIEQASAAHPWEHKIEKIFWRGALSGNNLNMETIDKLPRLSLGVLSKLYPDLIDAQLTGRVPDYSKSGNDAAMLLDILFGPQQQNHMSQADHLNHKYLASIDGATCAWQRVPWIMLSNSVLLKQESSFMEWFYPAMQPYVHYVPMDTRLTNLLEQLHWMNTHDEAAKQISHNASKFVKHELMPEQIQDHMSIILNEYHLLHKGKKLQASLPPAEETIAMADQLAAKGLTFSQKLVHGFRKFKFELKKKLWW